MKKAPAEADAPSNPELQCSATNPDVAARSPPPASAFTVAPPTTTPPATAERSIPIDTIVPIVFDMAVIMMAVAMSMTVSMTLMAMAMAVAGKCGRRKEQSSGDCRKETKSAHSVIPP